MHFKVEFSKKSISVFFLTITFILNIASAAEKDALAPQSAPAASEPKAQVNALNIGVVVPPPDQGGNRLLDAVLLAAEVFNPDSSLPPYKIVIEYARPGSEAAAAVRKLDQRGVVSIMSFLAGTDGEESAKEAQRLHIPIILIDGDKSLISYGDCIFLHSFSDESEMKALAAYAVEDIGKLRFAILYPDDSHGRKMSAFFKNEILKRGGRIVSTSSFDAENFEVQFKNLATNSPKEFSMIDAVFLPAGEDKVRRIAALESLALNGVKLLGVRAWNRPALVKDARALLEGSFFADGFFLYSFYAEVNDFSDKYYAAFSREPEFKDAMAFDTTKIVIAVLESHRVDSRDKFKQALSNLKYRGVTGLTSFSIQRDPQKEGFILTVKDGQIIQVK